MLATLATLGVTPDYLIYHRYPEYPGIECDFGVLQSQDGWATEISDLRQELRDYLPKAASQVEILCDENNVVGGGKQETSLVDGLYLADSFGSVIQTECNSYLFWDLYNAQKTDGNFADWLYGW
jgi:alpha-L-arabinofuranosidase